ncbi:hypothetical protein ACQ4PT_012151 [Festuca glaucescens]
MEEANFLTKYVSRVNIIHRRDAFRASKIMQARALSNPKIQVVWDSEVVEAYGGSDGGPLVGVKVKNLVSGEVSDFQVAGLFSVDISSSTPRATWPPSRAPRTPVSRGSSLPGTFRTRSTARPLLPLDQVCTKLY